MDIILLISLIDTLRLCAGDRKDFHHQFTTFRFKPIAERGESEGEPASSRSFDAISRNEIGYPLWRPANYKVIRGR